MNKQCAICSKTLNTENDKIYFCNTCYRDWGEEIKGKKPWIKFVVNNEHSRRRWDECSRGGETIKISLIQLYDNMELDVDGNIIYG